MNENSQYKSLFASQVPDRWLIDSFIKRFSSIKKSEIEKCDYIELQWSKSKSNRNFRRHFCSLQIEEESKKNCFIADLNFTQDLKTSENTFVIVAGKAKSFKDRNIFPRHQIMSQWLFHWRTFTANFLFDWENRSKTMPAMIMTNKKDVNAATSCSVLDFLPIDLRKKTRRMDGLVMPDEF